MFRSSKPADDRSADNSDDEQVTIPLLQLLLCWIYEFHKLLALITANL